MDMDYLKEYSRMCNAYPWCQGCPVLAKSEWNCQEWMGRNLREAKQVIADWAAANKEPVLPSINGWWRKKHPDAAFKIAPCYKYFLSLENAKYMCDTYSDCGKCHAAPIPAEFAPLMGVEVPE